MKRLSLALLTLGLLTAGAGAQPLEADVRNVKGALGDAARQGFPFPILAEVRSLKSEPVEVTVKAETGIPNGPVSEASLVLTPGSKHKVPLLLQTPNYGISVSLESRGRAAQASPVQANFVDNNDSLLMILSPHTGEFSYLGGYSKVPSVSKTDVHLDVPPDPSALPSLWMAYTCLDIIVVYDRPNCKLTPEVEQALVHWTRAGGTLVLVSNLDPQEYSGHPLGEILPMTPQGTAASGKLTFLDGPVQGEVLMRYHDRPLLIEARRSAGRVLMVTTPVATEDPLGTDLSKRLWGKVLSRRALTGPWVRQCVDESNPWLNHPPELPMPSAAALSWYLIGYVLLVGPVNYGLLRRKDRMLWVIVTVPVISLLFSGGAYMTNAWSRSSRTVLRELGMGMTESGSKVALVDSTVLLFSPRHGTYQLGFPPSCYGRIRGRNNQYWSPNTEDMPYQLRLDPPGMVMKDCAVDMWSAHHLRTLDVQGLKEAPFFELKAAMSASSPIPLKGCAVFKAGEASELFELQAGKKLVQALKFPAPTAGLSTQNLIKERLLQGAGPLLQEEDAQAMAGRLEALSVAMGPLLFGWTEEGLKSPMQVSDTGAELHRLALMVVAPAPGKAKP